MPVVDLYLPDDLPLTADAALGRSLANVVDWTTGPEVDPCAVFVHRLPVFAVVSADLEGVRTVRVQVCCEDGPWLDLATRVDQAVRTYLRTARAECPTRIVVSVLAATESHQQSWPPSDLRGLVV